MERFRNTIKTDVIQLQNEIHQVDNERVKTTNRLNDAIKDLKDKTLRVVKLETFMFENSNFMKMSEKHRKKIEEMISKNMITYQDYMNKIEHLIKNVTMELESIKDSHSQDFNQLANELNTAKEPLKHILEKAKIENEMILKELDRTQKNNRTLVNDYLRSSISNENQVAQSQVNLFCSMTQEDFGNSGIMRKSQYTFPRVCSVLTTSATGDDASINDIFRNTVSSFTGYKKDLRLRVGNSSKLRNITSHEVKSLTRDTDRYGVRKDVANDFIDENDKIKECKD